MIAILLGVAAAVLFIAYDAGTVLTTKDSGKITELTGLAADDLPSNKSKVLLRMLTARIVLYTLIAAVGIVVIFLVQRFIPKRR